MLVRTLHYTCRSSGGNVFFNGRIRLLSLIEAMYHFQHVPSIVGVNQGLFQKGLYLFIAGLLGLFNSGMGIRPSFDQEFEKGNPGLFSTVID